MENRKYLPLYNEWVKKGEIPFSKCNGNDGGLCGWFDKDELFQLLKPTPCELDYRPIWGYWGCDQEHWGPNQRQKFNPLRQNIVLFLACLNGEL